MRIPKPKQYIQDVKKLSIAKSALYSKYVKLIENPIINKEAINKLQRDREIIFREYLNVKHHGRYKPEISSLFPTLKT